MWFTTHHPSCPMRQSAPAVIVGPTARFREMLASNLCPAGFRIVASEQSLSDLRWEELPRSRPYLVVIECSESPPSLTTKVAQLRQRNPQARVTLLGHHWAPADIAIAFEAGASAYFAEATIGEEFLRTIKWITS
jgi:DNA-binding NarL/FixJ family response regulator